jgi:hypothetical protein
MNIVCKRQVVKVERFALDFQWNNGPVGCGLSFPCDKQGNPLLDEMSQFARKNLADCQSGKINVTFQGIRDYSYTYQEPARGLCSCGRSVELVRFTNTCDCGFEYNSCGQLLAPRSQWEEL